MKTYIFKSKIALVSILSIFVLSVQSKAQDTIFCFDEKYHWTYPCNYSDYSNYSDTTLIINHQASCVNLCQIGHMSADFEEPGKPPKPIPGYQVDKILTRQIFTDSKRKQIYGIAGTTIECHNPNGCYFYLYKKINGTFVVVDSAEWTHRNTDNAEQKYIAYDVRDMLDDLEYYENMPTTIEGETLTMPDSSIVEIHEAYFNTPIAVEDTFYIGTNWNGIDPFLNYIILEEPYTSSILVPFAANHDLNHVLETRWVLIKPDNSVTEYWGSAMFNCFFPIIQPLACVPINAVRMDNLTNNSVHISWEQSYLSSSYQIEYGPSGFQHGEGIFIHNISTTDYTLQGLDEGTEYTAYVRSYCSSSDTVSSWKYIEFKTLHTECPLVEYFDTAYVSDKMIRTRWEIANPEITFCQIEWGETGFEHGSGTVVNNIHDTTYTFRNLTSNTTYDIYLRTYCERSQVFGSWQKLTVTTDGDGTTAISVIDNDIPLELYPNPTTGLVTLSRTDINKIEVMDATGKVVMIVNNKNVIDLSKLAKGYYTLRITTTEGVAIRKVVLK